MIDRSKKTYITKDLMLVTKVLLPLIQRDIIVYSIPAPHPPAAGCQNSDKRECGQTAGIHPKCNHPKYTGAIAGLL